MAVLQLAVYRDFNEYECWVCGVPFAISQQFEAAYRRDNKAFYCPAGCKLGLGKSEEQKLREQLAEKDRLLAERARQLDFERERAATNYAAREKAERKAKKLEKRIAGGVCPCCQRSFEALARHMKTKHPEFVVEAKS